ncbi:protein of unknown function [Agreia bicolorata]|uniref:Uncharacterized protein n=1 Tax=Agreia bicolorata TaxID=110935 RepID=A0A1T4XWJ9_9MICO|nr:DUF4878 domain-containing protein [Agreia bicolorata]SKA93906.1 protein of unknown function [Agreia bicolorata]
MSDNDDKAADKNGANPLPAFPGAAAEPDAPSAPPASTGPQQPDMPKAPTTPPAPAAPQAPYVPQAPSAGQAPTAPQAPQTPAAPQQLQYAAPQPGTPPYASPQYGSQPAGAYTPPTKPKGKLGTGAIIGIVGGALVLVILLVIAVGFGVSRIVGNPGGGGGGAPAAEASSPSDAVKGYLTAIADSDAKTALSYLSSPPSDSTLLTDEALEASNKLGPITKIEVPKSDGKGGSADVTASYLMNGEPVSTTFSAYVDGGKWKISGGTGSIYTEPFDGLGLTINGQAVDTDQVDVFPGTYELATSLKNFTLTGPTTVTVTESYSSADTSQIEPALTDEALQQFRSLVRAAVEACVASTTLAAGCGLDLPATISDGTQLTDGTITRTLSADSNATLDSLEATPSYDNPTLVEGEYIGSPEVSADCTKDGASGRCSIYFAPALGTPSVDMASDNPVVKWD